MIFGDHHSPHRRKTYGSMGNPVLANTIITLTSLTGLFVILYTEKCNAGNQYVTDFFITLAASTMLGDAFFHILPRVLGIHDHALDDDHENHRSDQSFQNGGT